MEPEQPAPDATRPPPTKKKKSVLLIDAEPERQQVRAQAMRERGVTVDAVHSGAEALSMWKPRLYQLVMIEPAGAPADVDEFYRRVLDLEPDQKFAFYSGAPPYLTPALSNRQQPAQNSALPAAKTAQPQSGLPEAGLRIGGIRPTPPAPPQPGGTTRATDISFSEAVKNAERDLRSRS
jgi:CheY-like chemotaxis protein